MNNTTLATKLQQKIKEAENGVLLIVKLINEAELKILVDNIEMIVQRFQNMVNKVSLQIGKCSIFKDPMSTRVYVIIPDLVVADKFAHLVYSQVQLYVDPEFPESYLKCGVGSIKFQAADQAEKLISYLLYGMTALYDKSYYYNYDDNPINIEQIRRSNISLNELRIALFNKKAKFVYQPIVDCKSGNIDYYECLLRIVNEKNQTLSVGNTVEEAEAKGLISIVDFTVVEMAIAELVQDPNVRLSINISNTGVVSARLLRKIEELLTRYDVASRLIIEITESSLNRDFKNTSFFIDSLHKYGCKFALDDFGSGFTSFKQLLNLPIDIIKIDGSYIRDILSNHHSRTFVEALINLAKELKIKTVAEFVENSEIAEFLIKIKIDAMQGNFFLPASSNRIH